MAGDRLDSPCCAEEVSDAELISRSARGDRQAFDLIVVRHGPFALRVAMRLLRDRQVAEDVAQEAMVRAWSQSGQFDPERARFTTWLYRIVMNLCIDYRRRARPEPMSEDFDPVDPSARADEVLEEMERRVELADAMKELPVRQRAAITLVYDEGLSGIEAGRALGVSPKAVERLLARGRAFLLQHLRRKNELKETG